ncbi:MAG: uracil-DNA glycosylase [Bacillota bacterium]|nr:uracil-DNA glycosylase [Bacillota bacterium]
MLEDIKQGCLSCRKCRLCETRNNVVFGTGSETADIMFVGEAPGKNEDETGVPFVGAAGKLLERMLDAVDLSRNDIYIANIVKCRPPQNRDPLADEEDACIPYLFEQIHIIKPKVVVCLGRISAKRLIHSSFQITHERGKWFTMPDYDIMATFHPAALIYDSSKKGDTFLDFKEIKRKASEL